MDAALKRMADIDFELKDVFLESLGEKWASCIRHFFEGVVNPDGITLPRLRRIIGNTDKDSSDRMEIEIEIEDAEFRLKCGSELGRFDQFWDDFTLFLCRYSRSKWLYFWPHSTVPLEVYCTLTTGCSQPVMRYA